MINYSFIDFQDCKLVNNLLNTLIGNIGFDKTKMAINQSIDLQRMHTSSYTIPVLIMETCGSALASLDNTLSEVVINSIHHNLVVILSSRNKEFQLINSIYFNQNNIF